MKKQMRLWKKKATTGAHQRMRRPVLLTNKAATEKAMEAHREVQTDGGTTAD
jgi:hypothetical protein